MKRTMRILGLMMTFLMLVSMSAAAGNGNGKGHGRGHGNAYGHYNRELKEYYKFENKMIRINNRNFDNEDMPVIKDGRTLMPVRALVAALGGEVEWDDEEGIATIIRYDGLVKIEFYLRDEDGLILIYEREDTDDDWGDGDEIESDVHPGIINGRTFAPLRFLAENFEFRVGWNEETGVIDITDRPVLHPKKVKITEEDDRDDDIEIGIVLNGYDFDDIDGLVFGNDPQDADYTTGPAIEVHGIDCDMSVILYGEYVETLPEGDTELEFDFEDGSDRVSREFEIEIEIEDEDEDDEDEDDEEPSIDPEETEYDGEALDFDVDWAGYDLDKVMIKSYDGAGDKWDLVSLSKYEWDSDEFTLLKDYLEILAADLELEGEEEAEFKIYLDGTNEKLEIEVDFEDYLED